MFYFRWSQEEEEEEEDANVDSTVKAELTLLERLLVGMRQQQTSGRASPLKISLITMATRDSQIVLASFPDHPNLMPQPDTDSHVTCSTDTDSCVTSSKKYDFL